MLRSIGLTFSLFLVFLGPAFADEQTGSGLKALKTLLADIGAESDDAFKAYKERAKLTADTIAPKGLRLLFEQSDIPFGEMKADITCREGVLEVGWRAEAPVEGSIDEAEKMILDGLKAVGAEPNKDLPKGREAESQVRMIQVISQRVTTLSRQSGTAKEFIVVGLADRNARPGSQVRVLLQWTASAPFDGPPLTLQEAMHNLPMLKNAPIEPEVLKVTMAAVLGRFETGLQDRQLRTQRFGRSFFSGDGWALTTATDIRPEVQEALTAAGYSLQPERSSSPEGYESKRWRHDKAGNLVGWMFVFSPLHNRNTLNLHGRPPLMAADRP